MSPDCYPRRESSYIWETAGTERKAMTQNPRSRANLKRGGIVGTPESAARAREAKAQQAARLAEVTELATADPWAAYDLLHESMTRHIVKLLRDEERSGSQPSRQVTDRLREYRFTTEALSAYRGSRGVLEDAREFFETLDARVQAVHERMPGGPEPAIDLPM